jgi:hypothetical protein
MLPHSPEPRPPLVGCSGVLGGTLACPSLLRLIEERINDRGEYRVARYGAAQSFVFSCRIPRLELRSGREIHEIEVLKMNDRREHRRIELEAETRSSAIEVNEVVASRWSQPCGRQAGLQGKLNRLTRQLDNGQPMLRRVSLNYRCRADVAPRAVAEVSCLQLERDVDGRFARVVVQVLDLLQNRIYIDHEIAACPPNH